MESEMCIAGNEMSPNVEDINKIKVSMQVTPLICVPTNANISNSNEH